MNRFKIATFFLLFLLIVACNNKSISKSNDDFLILLSKSVNNKLFEENYFPLFVKCGVNKIFETNNIVLFEIYKKYYTKKFNNYELFLTYILNNKNILEISNLEKLKYNVFIVNENINSKKLKTIIEEYLILDRNKNFYRIKTNKFTTKDLKSIAYKMFQNHYIVQFDNYNGGYLFIIPSMKSPDFVADK